MRATPSWRRPIARPRPSEEATTRGRWPRWPSPSQFAVAAVAGDGTYSNSSPLFPGIGLILGGAATYAFAEWEARRNPPRVLIEKDTGKEITQTDRSDLFFIPIRYWGMLLVVVGIGAVIVGLFD